MLKLGYEAPRTGLHIAECFAEAGLPAGVLNVAHRRAARRSAPSSSRTPTCRAISFTGSVAVGHGGPRRGDGAQRRVQLELGGHNPLIVMADAELDRAVEARLRRRVLVGRPEVHRDATDLRPGVGLRRVPREAARAHRARRRSATRPTRRPRSARSSNERPLEEILAAIERGKAEGGTVARRRRARATTRATSSRRPLFEGVADDAFLSCEEVFGPVTSLYRFADARRGARSARTPSSSGSPRRSSRATSTPRSASRTSSRPGSSTSTRRPRAPTCTCRSAGSRARAAARTSRAAPRWSSTPRRSPSTRTRRLAERVSRHRRARLPRRLGRARRRSTTATRSSATTSATNRAGCGSCSATTRVGVALVRGDITDLAALERALDEHEITRVVHLAALQVPFVRANPPLGMHVNVAGTVNVFEAVSTRLDRIPGVAYASSAAVYNPSDPSPAPEAGGTRPATLYGVSKLADEGDGARLRGRRGRAVDRPAAVRRLRPRPRPGDDRPGPTMAMLAAVRGEPYHIGFSGDALSTTTRPTSPARSSWRRTRPTARTGVYNAPGALADVADVVAAIRGGGSGSRDHVGRRPAPVPAGDRGRRVRARGGAVPAHARSPTGSPRRSRTSAARSRAFGVRPRAPVFRQAGRAVGCRRVSASRAKNCAPRNAAATHRTASNEPVTSRIAPRRKGEVAAIV